MKVFVLGGYGKTGFPAIKLLAHRVNQDEAEPCSIGILAAIIHLPEIII
jgi:hypothetical protein